MSERGRKQVNVQRAGQEDLPALLELAAVATFPTRHPPLNSEQARRHPAIACWFADWGTRLDDTALLTWEGSSPVAAVWYRRFPDHQQHPGKIRADIPVLSLAVQPRYQRRGLGRLLLTVAREQAVAQCQSALSLCVGPANQRARTLYQQHGFRRLSLFPHTMILLLSDEAEHDVGAWQIPQAGMEKSRVVSEVREAVLMGG